MRLPLATVAGEMKAMTGRYWQRSIGGLAAATVFALAAPVTAAPLDAFARCLASRGAVFYGTDWCPHCRRQNELFGPSARYVRYVECNDRGRTHRRCTRKGVKSYPTWTFRDGSVLRGRQPLEQLASKTGCRLPR